MLLIPVALSATFYVDAEHDAPDVAPGDSICLDAYGYCTLRAAVMEANAFAGEDHIDLTWPNFVELSTDQDWGNWSEDETAETGDLVISEGVTIYGDGTTIYGDGRHGIFRVVDGARWTMLWDLHLEGAIAASYANASAVRMDGDGTLIVEDVAFRDNLGPYSLGSVTVTAGEAYVVESTFEDEGSAVSAYGGTTYVVDTTIRGGFEGIIATNAAVVLSRVELADVDFGIQVAGGELTAYHVAVSGSLLGLYTTSYLAGGPGSVWVFGSSFANNGSHIEVGDASTVHLERLTLGRLSRWAAEWLDYYSRDIERVEELAPLRVLDADASVVVRDSILSARFDDGVLAAASCSGPVRLVEQNVVESNGFLRSPVCRLSGNLTEAWIGSHVSPMDPGLGDPYVPEGWTAQVVPLLQWSPGVEAGGASLYRDILGNRYDRDGDGDGLAEGDLGAFEYQP